MVPTQRWPRSARRHACCRCQVGRNNLNYRCVPRGLDLILLSRDRQITRPRDRCAVTAAVGCRGGRRECLRPLREVVVSRAYRRNLGFLVKHTKRVIRRYLVYLVLSSKGTYLSVFSVFEALNLEEYLVLHFVSLSSRCIMAISPSSYILALN